MLRDGVINGATDGGVRGDVGVNGGVGVQKHNLFFAHGDILSAKSFDPFTHVYMFDIGERRVAVRWKMSRVFCWLAWLVRLVGWLVGWFVGWMVG